MSNTTHSDIQISETNEYTIIKVPKSQPPSIQVEDIHFDEFVGMLEDNQDDAGKTPAQIEDSAHEIWRATAD